MSETEKLQPDPDRGQAWGAEAPARAEQEQAAPPPPAQPPEPPQPEPPPPPPPPTPPAPRRQPRSVKLWVAAVVSAALLVGGGVGGYFVGVADDEDRPGAGRFGDHRPGDWPGFRERGPERPFNR